jgi:tetratricopeptide (TPR) repeat protein
LSLQDEIVAAIAERVQLQLAVPPRTTGSRLVNPDAHDAYLRGHFHFLKHTPTDLTTAADYFQLALQRDPDYAPAHAGLANVWVARGDRGLLPPHEAFPKAKAAAVRAMELDATIPEPHMALGNLNLFVEWDWSTSERAFRRALELNPSYVEAYLGYTHLLAGLRRFDEWQVHIDRARDLDPLNFMVHVFYGTHLAAVGRYDEAITSLKRSLDMQPGFSGAHLGLWIAFHQKGLMADALLEARHFFEAIRDQESVACFEQRPDAARYEETMRHIATMLASRVARAHVPAVRIARVFALARDDEQALVWLVRAYEQREGPLGYLAVGPEWRHLHGQARFRDLLRQMNLPALR